MLRWNIQTKLLKDSKSLGLLVTLIINPAKTVTFRMSELAIKIRETDKNL